MRQWKQQWPRIEANFGQPIQTRELVAPRVKQVSDDFLVRWNIDRQKAGAKAMMSVMWALRSYDFDANLRIVPPKTVVIFGDRGPTIANKDRFIGPMAEPRIEVMIGCGHFPMFDAPNEFCELVERYAEVRSYVPEKN